ncbi:hypothetical protein CERSUDRAFT_98687 [Gelatoporia subvermispora B]|uniref:Uncharacterized protein n=1 Tax=Ceriporiopsis subvermispora (strain B) TaxID=914234 RepID=M2R4E3_CERS8|nr:hypothetical protein CERSUDRAFT_98687 [Gelatoporia subvermispora B]
MPLKTRASNADKHLGRVDLPQPKRSSERVEADKKEKQAQAKQLSDKKEIAAMEDEIVTAEEAKDKKEVIRPKVTKNQKPDNSKKPPVTKETRKRPAETNKGRASTVKKTVRKDQRGPDTDDSASVEANQAELDENNVEIEAPIDGNSDESEVELPAKRKKAKKNVNEPTARDEIEEFRKVRPEPEIIYIDSDSDSDVPLSVTVKKQQVMHRTDLMSISRRSRARRLSFIVVLHIKLSDIDRRLSPATPPEPAESASEVDSGWDMSLQTQKPGHGGSGIASKKTSSKPKASSKSSSRTQLTLAGSSVEDIDNFPDPPPPPRKISKRPPNVDNDIENADPKSTKQAPSTKLQSKKHWLDQLASDADARVNES